MAQLPPAFRSVRGVCPRLRRRGARGARKAGPRSASKAPTATATARRRKTMAAPHPEGVLDGIWPDWRIVLGILQHKMMFLDGTVTRGCLVDIQMSWILWSLQMFLWDVIGSSSMASVLGFANGMFSGYFWIPFLLCFILEILDDFLSLM